ncbi:uncharacterized protein [Heterodontus francisci]|uniref:uncharacterized protein isoform X4 n=1 Tax=Heterodontus francisci TaxID=7792 RepID=UPI00355B3140
MPMDNNSVSALLLNIHCFEGLLLVDCPRESHKNGADVHSRDVITLQQKPSPFDFFLAILIQRDQLKRIYFQGKKKHSVQPTGSILRTLLKQFFGHFSYMKENMRVEARCNFRQLQDWKSKMLLSEMYHSAVTSLKMASHPLPHHGNALKTVNLLYLCGIHGNHSNLEKRLLQLNKFESVHWAPTRTARHLQPKTLHQNQNPVTELQLLL